MQAVTLFLRFAASGVTFCTL